MIVSPTESRGRVKGGTPLWSPEAKPLVGFRGEAPRLPLYPLFLRESRGKKQKDVDKFHRNGYDREDNRIIRDGSCGRGLHG